MPKPVDRIDVDEQTRHDLRTPLNQILGYSELLVRQAAKGDHTELTSDLEAIQRAARSLGTQLEDLFSGGGPALPPAQPAAAEESAEPMEPVARHSAAGPEEPIEQLPPGHLVGRILVVDDDDLNRQMLRRGLEVYGHGTSGAKNGKLALEMARSESFDLILLDVMMPVMDGLRALEQLKSDERLRNIPVIMISAYDELTSIVKCIELGAEDYLPKPFEPVVLRARVQSSLERKQFHDQELAYLQRIADERHRADELLHVILPEEVVEELKRTKRVTPRRYEDVAVLFCDVVDFTPYCESRQPEEVVEHLEELFEACEELSAKHDMEKIKTIGDSFMATAGLPRAAANPVLNCVTCGLEMIDAARRLTMGWQVRVGVHVGPIIAGVVGRRKYLFDIWGDTVNTASRLESHGVPGAVCVSDAAWSRVSDLCEGVPRGLVEVKGKGPIQMHLVTSVRPDA